ncbi:TPA: MarR family winged helix-turn-helix transcriptional regulator [Pseudomonas aeruginosa]|uniref:MarR family winged helix-turn-helix transcriptional regulator n=1 Tax=Pseudomonas TaxID=286 RepID=UPI0009AB3BCC|nr:MULTISPECIES: MarR family winged helix-turn-helix transcriptional regulator [Pseudomonas]EKX2958320.1 winged helix-turn-helix transcriptional regulator [Pseudomonas aeruginosa]MBG4113946.1 winged helix-turn-helix transcriptional regulator [Pseudomonas aeruginosa]MBI6936924.1 winged helix-turn-helix transcriptional regulator [Pseudomonas aeruginosa]MBI8014289.1 winged helix-turn-helix transcriptional regulator [Pseudomonas aeruginosa]MBV6241895.1 MarR family winged helix-turn-helix transcrip
MSQSIYPNGLDVQILKSNSLFEQLRTAHSKVKRFQLQHLAKAGMKLLDYYALVEISNRPGISQSELASKLDIDKTSVVKAMDNLEALEFAKRMPDPRSRRAYNLVPTESGIACALIYKNMFLNAQSIITENLLPEELNSLTNLLSKINSPSHKQQH